MSSGGEGPIEVEKLDNVHLERYFNRLMKKITEDIEKVVKDRNLYKL